MKKINTTKKVIQIANSVGVVIDKAIAKNMNVNKGDMVEVSFRKLQQQPRGKRR